jgi:hypothetical protein
MKRQRETAATSRACHARVLLRAATLTATAWLLTTPARAGEIEPRSYANAPVGTHFLLAGYVYSEGGLATAAALPIENAELRMNTGILAYAHSLDIAGKAGKIDLILPYSTLSGSARLGEALVTREVSGPHDPLLRFSYLFVGAPALTLEEFAGYQQDVIIGASLQVSAPLGQYDADKLVNLGGNRWFLKPDLGVSKAWGPLTLELSTGLYWFSDNDDFLGGRTLEQDPLSTTQLHVTYNFGKGIWAAASATYDYGGRMTVDGVRSDEVTDNVRIGATLALPVNRNNSLKLTASNGVVTRLGTDVDLFGIVWQYRWGGGL